MTTNSTIRVLIVDDSVVVRGALTKMLARDPSIEVVGTAADAYQAREKIVALSPDVLTLDIEMPRMDGMTFLAKIMQHRPMPVVMCSSVTQAGTELALRAIEMGAVDVVAKPSSTTKEGLAEVAIELIDKVKAAARANVRRHRPPESALRDAKGRPLGVSTLTGVGRVRGQGYATKPVLKVPAGMKRGRVIAIGASTGGTEALRIILERMPKETPGILIVQHMPEYFTLSFANRLDSLCQIHVKEAENGDLVEPGVALLAPGNSHLMVRRQGVNLVADVRKGPLVCRHRPSVEVLFQSMSRVVGPNSVGVILTGMGADGAQGMALLKQSGAYNIAQDEASCVVYGMPKEAVKCGGVDKVVHLERIGEAILGACC